MSRKSFHKISKMYIAQGQKWDVEIWSFCFSSIQVLAKYRVNVPFCHSFQLPAKQNPLQELLQVVPPETEILLLLTQIFSTKYTLIS